MKLFIGKNCMPCKMVKEWLIEKNIIVEQLLAEDNLDFAREVGVKVLPALLLEDNSLVSGKDNIIEYFEGENCDE